MILADAGIPMLLMTEPVLIVALPVVVCLEAWILRRRLRQRWGEAAVISLVANLASTLAGVPATWFALAIVQAIVGGGTVHEGESFSDLLYIVVVQAPWQAGETGPLWAVPAAALVLHIPFFLVSVLVEILIVRRMLKGDSEEAPKFRGTVLIANALSYGLLGAFWLIVLLRSIN